MLDIANGSTRKTKRSLKEKLNKICVPLILNHAPSQMALYIKEKSAKVN